MNTVGHPDDNMSMADTQTWTTNDDAALAERRLALRNLATAADKLSRMSMAAGVGSGQLPDHDQIMQSLADVMSSINHLCQTYQLNPPPSPVVPQPSASSLELSLQRPSSSAESTNCAPRRNRSCGRTKLGKACLECGRRDTAQWRRGPLGVSTLCNACGIRHARVMKKVLRQQDFASSPGCTPPLPDEADSHVASAVVSQRHNEEEEGEAGPGFPRQPQEAIGLSYHRATSQHPTVRSSVYALLN
jgi:hypothetical protein